MRGALSMLGAVCVFACMDVTMKRLAEHYPASQVTLLRGLSALPIMLAVGAAVGQLQSFRARRWSLHALRGGFSYLTLFCFVWAVARLSLVHCYAIFMSAPLLIVALSGPMLREHVSGRRWVAVLVGLLGVLGVLWALQPSASGFSLLPGLAALAAALGYALTSILIRFQVRSETGPATAFWGLFFQSVFSGALLAGGWVPLQAADWPLVLALGVTGSLGQHLITRAFRMAPVQLLAPLEYTALLWGIGFDALLWQVVPQLHVLTGAGIVVASGVYVLGVARRG
jgi:drug/metabolite transporter (DMT)-like permease